MVESQIQDRSFKILHYDGLPNFFLLSKQMNHAHEYVDNLTQLDPRFALHDDNSSSRVNQMELS